ncbi:MULTISPECIES: hypothetical protein [Neomoorella]|jgi:hypothetical protein|uniref:hypothetical protein n=1 Tax=Neomoorella TaxID=44260 RepID=UPI001FEC0E5E|nr:MULTISPECIES: hypothetical protein [Moorella]
MQKQSDVYQPERKAKYISPVDNSFAGCKEQPQSTYQAQSKYGRYPPFYIRAFKKNLFLMTITKHYYRTNNDQNREHQEDNRHRNDQGDYDHKRPQNLKQLSKRLLEWISVYDILIGWALLCAGVSFIILVYCYYLLKAML